MISKKILALVLALSVIVCALPAASVFAANESTFPYTAETLTFTAEELAANPAMFYMTTGVYIDLSKASDSFKRFAKKTSDVEDKIYMSGTIHFGDVVVNISKLPAKSIASKGELNFWASSFAANDKTLTAAMQASTEIPNMELDKNGAIDVGSTKLCIRNFKRYVLNKNGVEIKPEEDCLPEGETNMDKNPMYARMLSATSAEITLTYKTARPTATAAFDAGTIYVPSAKIANAVPSVEDAENGIHAWYLSQGLYQQHKEDLTGKPIAYCSAGQNGALGIDGPYYVFKATESGTYNVYASRRDRNNYIKNGNPAVDTDIRRDIYLNISGTDLSFKRKDIIPDDNDSTLDYWLLPEDNGTTVTLTAGQEVVVRLMDNTGAWAGSYGFVLVPVGKTHDGLVGTVISADNFASAHNYNVTAKQISEVTINTAENAATVNVTVNGKAVAAKTEGAYLKDAVKFNNIKRFDLNGNYIKAPTLLDALVEAEAVTSMDALGAVSVTLNGKLVDNVDAFDRIVLSENDVITCVDIDKTNFAPISMKEYGGERFFNNYGSVGTTDALYLAGFTSKVNATKLLTSTKAGNGNIWPVDVSVPDALAGCHLTGYITIKQDLTANEGKPTTGDDRLVKLYIDMDIIHSAQRSTGAVEFGYNDGDLRGVFLDNVHADINGDGTDEEYHTYLTNSKLDWYDFSNVYLVNTNFNSKNVVVTATETADGYNLKTTVTVPVTLVRVVKDSEGNLISTVKTHDVLDFMDADGLNVTVAENETVYVWKGTNVPAGTTMVPLCAPLTK